MEIEFDEAKQRKILEERGLDLADAALVFADEHYQVEDDREDYGELRYRVWASYMIAAFRSSGRRGTTSAAS